MDIYYKVQGSDIFVTRKEEDIPLPLFGLTWTGFEWRGHVVGGLNIRNWIDVLETIKNLGFNAIRLPFCVESVRPRVSPAPRTINYALNPDLVGLDSISIMEKIIAKAAELNLYILLCFHNISCLVMENLWYTPIFSEEKFIEVWISMAKRFKKYWNIVGVELFNNPHGRTPRSYYYTSGECATWGVGNSKTDWNLAAERIGKAVLEVAPHWLIIVKGTQLTNPKSDEVPLYIDNVFWGENLRAVRDYPVNLPRDKLVYGVNIYGPDVYVHPYINDPNIFPSKLNLIWDQNWGYVKKELGYPLIIAEFGGKCGEGDPRDVIWHQKFIEYMIENNLCYWFYLALNPDNSMTGGIFKSDWRSIREDKLLIIRKIMDYCKNRYNSGV